MLFAMVAKRGEFITFAPVRNGAVAEWLGRALQKLLQRFESARDLTQEGVCVMQTLF